MINAIVKDCDDFTTWIKQKLKNNEQKTKNAIARIKKNENTIYMIMKQNEKLSEDESDSSEDVKPKKK
jgi:hypothetical protein